MTTAALTAPSAANAAPRLRPAGPVPTEPQTTTLEPVIEGPAAMTAAVRGSAYLDGLIHIASRHTVSPGVVRLGSFDPFSGEQAGIRDLAIEAGAGNTSPAGRPRPDGTSAHDARGRDRGPGRDDRRSAWQRLPGRAHPHRFPSHGLARGGAPGVVRPFQR